MIDDRLNQPAVVVIGIACDRPAGILLSSQVSVQRVGIGEDVALRVDLVDQLIGLVIEQNGPSAASVHPQGQHAIDIIVVRH